ncbi:MAG: type I glutamate--ammonia ligase [Acidobacteria bacterium]|nr:type I glutamate--ammonia ligase [Acidobacteriota bacterium]
MTPDEVLKQIKDDGIQMVDLRFVDFPGLTQHFSVVPRVLTADKFQEGLGFDGSSIRGWRNIHESDMLVIPDPETAFIDPFFEHPTLVMMCDILDPVTREAYGRCPRTILKKAVAHLQSTGVADSAFFGPEAEFFIFDEVRFDTREHESYYHVDSIEGQWNTGRQEPGGNLGFKPRHKEGYFPTPPTDKFQDLRTEMVLIMERCGIEVEVQHHEVATAGQAEIDLKFDNILRMADKLVLYKYIVKNTAIRHGKTATFMPKPLWNDNASGMHVHQSLWKDSKPLFAGDGYAGFSELGLHYIGGLLKHAKALTALTAPTTNSFKRLVPGFEAPVNLAYSSRNRSACCRIPVYASSPKSTRVEFRSPDPSCNPYLAFAGLLMAGLDGVLNKIHPGEPVDKDLYDLPPEEAAKIEQLPGSLAEALDILEGDHQWLLEGDVFSDDVIHTWLEYKRQHEVNEVNQRPHPYEFHLYYDV